MKRDARTIGNIFAGIADTLGISEKIRESRVMDIWKEILGEQIEVNARMTKFEKGTGYIETKSSTWAVEITIRKDKLIQKINDIFGEQIVKELIIY